MKRFKKILCVVDIKNNNNQVLKRAISLAQNNGAKLTVLSVIEPLENSYDFLHDNNTEKLQNKIKDETKKIITESISKFSNNSNIEVKVTTGVIFLQVIYEVLKNNHDLVMKTPQKADWLDKLFGSDDMHILRKCPCPVWMIKENTPETYEKVVASVDINSDENSEDEIEIQNNLNKKIIQIASSLAINESSHLDIVHAWYAQGEAMMSKAFIDMKPSEIAQYVKGVEQYHSTKLANFITSFKNEPVGEMLSQLKPKSHLIKGLPSEVIPGFVKKLRADLVVMGTVGRTGIPGFIIGNTAEDILNQIDCSVLAIKPEGFVSPVKLVD